MKRWMLGVLLLSFLSACTLDIGLSGKIVIVDGPAVESDGLLGEGQSARFEILVGSSAVRVDVLDVDNGAAGSLLLRVYNANNTIYAQTVSRQYFAAPQPEVLGLSAGKLIVPNGVYSINLPANFGRAYVEVTNLVADPTVVRVAAVSRNSAPIAGNFSETVSGALLFLGQLDTWTYTGQGPATLDLVGGSTVHARAKVVRDQTTQVILEPGESFNDLQSGDVVHVQTQGNGALAGFCDDGVSGNGFCDDGIETGEYILQVTP